jgi:hypothetical protein
VNVTSIKAPIYCGSRMQKLSDNDVIIYVTGAGIAQSV